MFRKLLLSIGALLISLFLFAAKPQKDTQVYAVKDGQELKLDIYAFPSEVKESKPCLIFVFGGGFKEGSRDAADYTDYFTYFAEKGFAVVSIDYRLGMKDAPPPGIFNTKPLRNAIAMAVADLYSATNYLLQNAETLNIDTSRIIISGSSAGAITVLQADYEARDHKPSADVLPEKFHFAGVISFAGGIFSTEGVPSYTQAPAPTLFFHGSADKLVPYDKTRFFRIGMFGSKSLAKRFREKGYPYLFYSMEGLGHEVAGFPMKEFLPEIEQFIVDFVINRKQWLVDIRFKDKLRRPEKTVTPKSYYD